MTQDEKYMKQAIKQAKKAFYGDTALIEGADTTACMQLENMDSMYYGCMALASVQIPDSAKELSNICNGCVNLKEVHIPSSAQKMNSSFFGCTALESITGEIPSSCTDSGNLFSGCKFLSGTLTVSCTSKTTLSSSFSDAATAGTGLTIILRYDAEKSQETIELMQLDHGNIHVGQYMTKMPPKELLEQKLSLAIANARELLEQRKEE